MWGKGIPLILLVGLQSCAATLGNGMEVPQKVQNRAARGSWVAQSVKYLP